MILNIATGNNFSQIKLFLYTNKFFHTSKWSSLITHKEENYVVEIRKKTICILLSKAYNQKDLDLIKMYIEKMFRNKSILVDSNQSLDWLDDITNVKIKKL